MYCLLHCGIGLPCLRHVVKLWETSKTIICKSCFFKCDLKIFVWIYVSTIKPNWRKWRIEKFRIPLIVIIFEICFLRLARISFHRQCNEKIFFKTKIDIPYMMLFWMSCRYKKKMLIILLFLMYKINFILLKTFYIWLYMKSIKNCIFIDLTFESIKCITILNSSHLANYWKIFRK